MTLRPATRADTTFLAMVHDGTRDDLVGWGLTVEQVQPLLDMQRRAQEQAWSATFADALRRHVIVVDGIDVGRLYLAVEAGTTTIVDIAVLPDHRGRGVGTAVLTDLLDSATGPVQLHVTHTNPAARLYLRLGFTVVDADEVRQRMRIANPGGQVKSAS